MAKNNAVVGVYDSHTKAEASIKELQRSGFDMKKLSIVGKDYHTEEHVIGYYNAGDRMKVWGKLGAFWGGLWGRRGAEHSLEQCHHFIPRSHGCPPT